MKPFTTEKRTDATADRFQSPASPHPEVLCRSGKHGPLPPIPGRQLAEQETWIKAYKPVCLTSQWENHYEFAHSEPKQKPMRNTYYPPSVHLYNAEMGQRIRYDWGYEDRVLPSFTFISNERQE